MLLQKFFVIFPKVSLYNLQIEGYDGKHEKLGEEGFKNYISSILNRN